MEPILRCYQNDLVNRAEEAWNRGKKVIMGTCATGSGKTVMMTELAHRARNDYGVAVAHRGVLVAQVASTLARRGISHNVIGPKSLIRSIVDAQMEDFGRSYYDPSAPWTVASVKTLVNRADQLGHLRQRVRRGFIDEGHHVLLGNTWGNALQLFPNAEWWLPSATPERADGKGLGIPALGGSGLVEELHCGPPPRWLINNGYLCDYKVRAPIASDLDMSDVEIGSNGEYNKVQATRAVKRSKKLIGSIVDTYLKFTPGMLGVVFAQDIEHAKDIVELSLIHI